MATDLTAAAPVKKSLITLVCELRSNSEVYKCALEAFETREKEFDNVRVQLEASRLNRDSAAEKFKESLKACNTYLRMK